MNLLGPHIHIPGMGLDLLERGQFAAALAMDVDSAYVREVRRRSPETTLVVRVYEDGAQFLDWSPQDWVNRLLARFPADKPDYFVTINEPLGHDSSELFERFDIWESEVIRLLQAAGTDGLACNFGTGNFTAGPDRVKIPDVFPRICAVANAMGGHDYSWPNLWDGVYWYALRWCTWFDDILATTGREMKFLVGECGLTQAIIWGRPDHGWRSGADGVTDASYLDTLRWYNNQLCQWEAEHPGCMLGACIFNWYDQFHHSFEHIDKPEVVDAILAMDCPVIPEQPPDPEPPEEPMAIKVYDFNSSPFDPNAVPRDMAYLRSIFGDVQVHKIRERINPQAGDKIYEVEWFDCRVGDVAIMVHIEDEYGNGVEGAVGILGWPDAPSHDLPRTWNLWSDQGAVGSPSDANGDEGLGGYGEGAYYGPPEERGPHSIWLYSLPSDMVDGLGMLTWAQGIDGNHLHVNIGWRARIVGAEDPDPDPDPPGDVQEELLAIGDRIKAIAVDWGRGTPSGMTLTYPDGGRADFTVSPTGASLFARLRASLRLLRRK